MLEVSNQETELVVEVENPKKNKLDGSDLEEEEDESNRPAPQTAKRKKQLDTCEH